MRIIGRIALAALIMVVAGLVPVRAEPFKVNSGQVLNILSIMPEKTERGRALVMRFSTRTPLSDLSHLRREADQLWEHFAVNAEAGNFRRAIIRAEASPRTGKHVDFVYVRRGPDWRTLEKGLGPGGTLTEGVIRAHYERNQDVIKHRNWNVVLLYTAKDLTIHYSFPGVPGAAPFTLDRQGMLAMSRHSVETIEQYDRRSEVLSIKISPDGKSAHVESREIEHLMINGRLVTGEARALSELRLIGGAVVVSRGEIAITNISVGVDL